MLMTVHATTKDCIQNRKKEGIKIMLSYIAAFIFGGMWGFIVCAFLVGTNQRRWEERHWRKDLNLDERNDNNDKTGK